MDSQEIIRRLNLRGKSLSKGHRRIAAYIAEHSDKAAFMTAVTLGQSCGVSESTVVRFATAMGYEGYPELQAALQELVRQRLTASERFNIAGEIKENDVLRTVLKNDMRNIRMTTEDLSEKDFTHAVELLLAARRIYVMGLIFDDNYRDLDGFYDFVLNDIGADKLKLNFLQPSFGCNTAEDRFFAEHYNVDPDLLYQLIQQCDQKYQLALNPVWMGQVRMYFQSLQTSRVILPWLTSLMPFGLAACHCAVGRSQDM